MMKAGNEVAYSMPRDEMMTFDGFGGANLEQKRAPGTELAMRRLRELVDGVTKVSGVLNERTQAVRVDGTVSSRASSDRAPRPVSCDLATSLHGYADQLESALSELHRIEREIDL